MEQNIPEIKPDFCQLTYEMGVKTIKCVNDSVFNKMTLGQVNIHL